MLWAAQPRNVCGVSHFMDYQAVSHLSDLAHSSGVVAAAQSGRVAKGFFWNVGLRHYLAHGRRLCADLGDERFQLGKAHRADAGHQIRQNAKTNAFVLVVVNFILEFFVPSTTARAALYIYTVFLVRPICPRARSICP